MNRLMICLLTVLMLTGCKQQDGPDLSEISAPLTVVRYDREFFALDTLHLSSALDRLFVKYPGFTKDYLYNILGIPPVTGSDTQILNTIKKFLHDYRPVYDSVQRKFPDLDEQTDQLRSGLKHVRYYFPQYPLPDTLYTFIGPMDAFFQGSTAGYGDVITGDGLAIGLQLHLGAGFSMYQSEMGLQLYPAYLSRRFSPAYIPVNSIKNIVDDLFPEQEQPGTLIEQMVEKGKKIYLTDQLMPQVHDSLILGYTGLQLKGTLNNEGAIWNYFIKNGLVFNNDPSLIKNYVGESPGTPEFGEGAPGNIGLFVGWRIVETYMQKHESVSLNELMNMNPRKIFEESGYRPR